MNIKQISIITIILAVSAQAAAFAEAYEAWYEASTDSPKSTPIPAKVHTYYDGKKFYTKTKTALGDTIGYYVEVPQNPSMMDFAKDYDAKSLGVKIVKGKECHGLQFNDPLEKRLTENWYDDKGRLYYQIVNNSDGGKYEQTRSDFKIDPETCSLPTDPDITSSNSSGETTAGQTVPVNADESPFTQTGKEKTKLRQPEKF